jgi:ABC-type antimicrobial peptide transport system permease subunit
MALARTVQDEIHELDPDVAFSRVWTMEEAVERLLGPFRVSARLVTLFASLALLLAAVGLYGVLAYLVVQRTRTIGIRMALGASARRVAAAVMARGLKLAAAGIVAGVAAALWAAGLVSSFLFEVAPRDPLSFAAVAAILAAVACAAGLLPAWRAARVDPIVALRDE